MASEFLRNYEFIIEEALDEALSMERGIDRFGDISSSLRNFLFNYDAEVFFYGSRFIGIANQGSDLDIFVCVSQGPSLTNRDAYYSGRNRRDQIKILEVLRAAFFNQTDWEVERRGISYRATVPILYAHYTGNDRDLHCQSKLSFFSTLSNIFVVGEIAVRDGRSTETSLLLKHLFDIQPQAKALFHFIRIWLEEEGINLKGYQITLLVVFYLQQRNLMPSVQTVQRNLPLLRICGEITHSN